MAEVIVVVEQVVELALKYGPAIYELFAWLFEEAEPDPADFQAIVASIQAAQKAGVQSVGKEAARAAAKKGRRRRPKG